MSTTASNAAVRSTEDKPKRKGGAVAALAALGLGAHALRKGVIKKHGSFDYSGKKVAVPGMWSKAAKSAAGDAKKSVKGAVAEAGRRVKNAGGRVEARMKKQSPQKPWEKADGSFWNRRGGASPKAREATAALAEVCARELAAIAPERELQAPGLVANERGEMPWQAHQRKKRNERLVKTGAAAALTGAVGYGAHRVAQAAGGYKKLHGDFKFRNKMHGTGYAMKRAGQDLKPAAQQVAGKAVSAVKGAGRGAMEALKRLRGR